ncbi:FkbM family methyltransferase [Sphingomonas sp. KRR8]|uniref:FkbM family methyltransferase n=1 Tax=Sphingomonas sp. KRR8 TaxID=2942996 RepID=UPI0020213B35|nr:FkbM family methyltransferase [Sphingomonas sp. KRR8]URD60542.1 FkbM family methyltransferase [Sphingomonas sp. KRR8]
MNFTSYAQNFEDVLLWRALGHIGRGRYLDIGAQDPEIDSVSLGFYEHAWRGVHVEPTAAYAQKIREKRPDEIVIEAAVSTAEGPITFYEFAGTGLSTGVSEIAEAHDAGGFERSEVLVPTIRLSQLLDRAELYHWMKIDVEGMEADALASWDDHPARPWVVVVEATEPNSQERTDHLWRGQLEDRGYEDVYFDGLSRYFLHQSQGELKQAFAIQPNIFDGFVVGEHHFVAREMLARLNEAEGKAAASAALATAIETEAATLRHLHAERVHEVEQVRKQLLESHDERLAADERARDALNRMHGEEIALRIELARLEERAAAPAAEIQRLCQQLEQASVRLAEVEDRRSREVALANEQRLEVEARAERARQALEELHSAERVEFQRQALEQLALAEQRVQAERERANEALETVRAQAEAERRALHGAMEQLPGVAEQEQPQAFQSDIPGAGHPYSRAASLPELLGLHGADFIRCAYVTLLGREADPEGERHYGAALRAGATKLDILWQLRRSPEGRKHDPGIAGLDAELRRARRARLPLVGGLFPDSRLEPQRGGSQPVNALHDEIGRLSGQLRANEASIRSLEASVAEQRALIAQVAAEQREAELRAAATPEVPAITIEQIIGTFENPLRE